MTSHELSHRRVDSSSAVVGRVDAANNDRRDPLVPLLEATRRRRPMRCRIGRVDSSSAVVGRVDAATKDRRDPHC